MQFLKSEIKKNETWIIAAFLNWLLLLAFQTDRFFFSYDRVNIEMAAAKFLSLCLLEFIWIAAGNLFLAWKNGKPIARRYVNIWCLYSLIICTLLVLLWPGTWSWDDLWVLESTQNYRLAPWQHILSSFEQMILLQIFPFMGGYVLLKNLLIAAIVAYVICKIEVTFKLKPIFANHYWLDILFKLIPFLLPPVILYQFSGYRIGLYIYLELLLFVVLIASIKNRYRWSSFRIFVFSILVGVCACWRSESFFFVLLGIVFFAFSHNFSLTTGKRILGVLLVIFWSILIMSLQGIELGNDNYKLVSTMRQSVELIRVADVQEDASELATIDKVLDVSIIKAHPDHNGETVFWNDNAVKKYSKEDFDNYLKATCKLALKYPDTFWKERWQLFEDTTGLSNKNAVNNVRSSIAIYQKNSENYKNLMAIKTEHKYSIFPKLRSKIISIMGGEVSNKRIQPYYAILWNSIVPMIALFFFWIISIYKKEWQIMVVTSFLIIKIPIVFFTAPSNWFMYYLSFYLLGYVLIDFFFVYKFGFLEQRGSHEK